MAKFLLFCPFALAVVCITQSVSRMSRGYHTVVTARRNCYCGGAGYEEDLV